MNLEDAIKKAFEQDIGRQTSLREQSPCPTPERWWDVRLGLEKWTQSEENHISGCKRCARIRKSMGWEDEEVSKEPVLEECQPVRPVVTPTGGIGPLLSRLDFLHALTAAIAGGVAACIAFFTGQASGEEKGEQRGYRLGREDALREIQRLKEALGLTKPVAGNFVVLDDRKVAFVAEIDTRSVQLVTFRPHPKLKPIVVYTGPATPPNSLEPVQVVCTETHTYELTGERIMIAADVRYYPGHELYPSEQPVRPRVALLSEHGISLDPPDQAEFDAFWVPFVVKDSTLPSTTVVLGSADLLLPDPDFPQAKDYVGVRDAQGAAIIVHRLFTQGSPPEGVELVPASDATTRAASGPEILLGGPSVNDRFLPVMRELLGVTNIDDPQALKRSFRFVLRPSGERLSNAFVRSSERQEPDGTWAMGVEDVATGELCSVSGLTDPETAVDTAIVIRGDMGDGRPVLAVAGFEQWGGLAAVKAISQPGPIVSRFHEQYQKTGYAEMVIQTKTGTTEPVLYQFPSASNPRGQ